MSLESTARSAINVKPFVLKVSVMDGWLSVLSLAAGLGHNLFESFTKSACVGFCFAQLLNPPGEPFAIQL